MATLSSRSKLDLINQIMRSNKNLEYEYNADKDLSMLFFKNEKIMETGSIRNAEWKMSSQQMNDKDLYDILELKGLIGGTGDFNKLPSEDTIKYSPENGWGFDE